MVGGEQANNEEVKERRKKKKKYAEERRKKLLGLYTCLNMFQCYMKNTLLSVSVSWQVNISCLQLSKMLGMFGTLSLRTMQVTSAPSPQIPVESAAMDIADLYLEWHLCRIATFLQKVTHDKWTTASDFKPLSTSYQ